MSWSRTEARLRGMAAALTAMMAVSGLAACTVAPVYAPAGVASPGVAADLAAISIEPPANRVEQQVRNALIFAFTGGGEAALPRYRLRLTVNVAENQLGVTNLSVSPSYKVDVAVSYELATLDGSVILTRGVVRGAGSYDRSNQGFANERARLDAQDRGATAAADEIRLRIAATLAQRR